MARYNEFIRMYKLVQLVTRKNKRNEYPTKLYLLYFLKDEGYDISPRTLDNDLASIRSDFRTELIYSKKFKGYYIDKDKSDQYDSFFRFIEIVTLAEIFNNSLKDNKKILNFVSFDDSKSFTGIENLKEILIALNQHKILSFTHYNFEKQRSKKYEIIPIKLKEYENRWYIIGIPDKSNKLWSFGIDRMTDLQIKDLHMKKIKHFDKLLKKYDDIIGISLDTGSYKEKVKVELLIDNLHVNYLASLPLHHSQEIFPKNKDGKHKVTFYLIPNYEFKTQILKMGDYAEVHSPIELRNEIKSMLQNMFQKYM